MYYTVADLRTGYDARIPSYGLKNIGEITYVVSPNEANEPRLLIQISYGRGHGHSLLGAVPLDTPFGVYDADKLPLLLGKRCEPPEITKMEINKSGDMYFEWEHSWQLGNTHQTDKKDKGFIRVEYLVEKLEDKEIWKSYYKFQPIRKKELEKDYIHLRFCVVAKNGNYLKSEWVYSTYPKESNKMTIDWEKYIDEAQDEVDKEARIDERNKWLDENAVVYGPGHVISWQEKSNGDHIRSDGTLLSTKESREKADIPQWKKFEIGRLDMVDNQIVPGPNALQKDIDQYNKNIAKTGREKTMTKHTKTRTKVPSTSDLIDVEDLKLQDDYILVPVSIIDYPPDRDELVGRVWISADSTVSLSALEAKEAGQRYIETVTLADMLHFILPISYKWGEFDTGIVDKRQVKLQFYFRDSESRREVDRWSCVKDLPVKQEKPVIEKPTKIIPDDSKYTPIEKALNWAAEAQHGKAHQNKWQRVAAMFGANNGYDPYTFDECKQQWLKHGKNKRWTMVMSWFETEDKDVKEMERYYSPLSMQGHYTVKDWKALWNADPIICKFEGYEELTIYDPGAGGGMPNWWLEGPGPEATQLWRLEENGDYTFVKKITSNAKSELYTATLREVYENEIAGGWRDSYKDENGVWFIETPEGDIRYPDIMQPDESVEKPAGHYRWTPSGWLEHKMKEAGYEGEFEAFLRYYESYDTIEAEKLTPEQLVDFEFRQKLIEDGPESWVVATSEELPEWYWNLDVWPMNTGDIWGKIQIAPGYFCFYDGSGPRGRWSLSTELLQEAEEDIGSFVSELSDDEAEEMFELLKKRLGE